MGAAPGVGAKDDGAAKADLPEQVSAAGWRQQDFGGCGDCAFRALAAARLRDRQVSVQGTAAEVAGAELRAAAVAYLRKNLEKFKEQWAPDPQETPAQRAVQPTAAASFEEYLTAAAGKKFYADGLLLTAVAEHTKTPIVVWFRDGAGWRRTVMANGFRDGVASGKHRPMVLKLQDGHYCELFDPEGRANKVPEAWLRETPLSGLSGSLRGGRSADVGCGVCICPPRGPGGVGNPRSPSALERGWPAPRAVDARGSSAQVPAGSGAGGDAARPRAGGGRGYAPEDGPPGACDSSRAPACGLSARWAVEARSLSPGGPMGCSTGGEEARNCTSEERPLGEGDGSRRPRVEGAALWADGFRVDWESLGREAARPRQRAASSPSSEGSDGVCAQSPAQRRPRGSRMA